MSKLILGSTSSSRYKLLKKLKIDFESAAPDIDESPLKGETAAALVERLAIAKAGKIATTQANSIIIGADQVADFNGQILGKPGNYDNAFATLSMLSGHKVTFYTGMCVMNSETQEYEVCVEPFTVIFRQLTASMIDNYLKKDEPWHCAGSFQIEGLGITLFEKLIGDDYNALIGLPLIKLTSILPKFGIHVLD